MHFFEKMERKLGRYAIRNLMFYIIGLYALGLAVNLMNPMFYGEYLSLNVPKILEGQIWRVVTFMLGVNSDIFGTFLLCYVYYIIGTQLERAWGSFRMNVYVFGGILLHIIAAFLAYFIADTVVLLSPDFLNASILLAFSATYPNLLFYLFFIIPIKAKWIGIIEVIGYVALFVGGTLAMRIAIGVSFLNFTIYFLMTRNLRRYAPKEVKRRRDFQKVVKPAMQQKTNRHCCAVCGKTEKTDENSFFRFCSKCEGNYEYCEEHLYTHIHVVKEKNDQ